ncbi:MAG TPA: hypothetical protein VEO74_17430 [Thermoanaerobaculia bacterium]|nr:hypothetical protein [Thermoanaerobaculia bacterium]
MRRLLSLAILAAGPLFASDIPVSAPSIVPRSGIEPAVATDGTDFLVVWKDDTRIRCARLRRGGTVADVPAKLLALDPATDSATPLVAYTTGRYLVLWRHSFTIVDGVLLDRDANIVRRITVPTALATAVGLDGDFLAANDGRFVMTSFSRATILSSDGDPIATLRLNTTSLPIVAASGGGFLLLNPSRAPCTASSSGCERMALTRMDRDGRTFTERSFDLPFDDYFHSFYGFSIASASDGGALIVFIDSRQTRLRGFTVDWFLQTLDAGIPLDGLLPQSPISTFWDGAHYVVASGFFDGRGFFAKRLGLDPEPVKVAEGFTKNVVLLPDRGGWFVVHDGFGEIRADLDVPADRIAVAQTVADQNFPLLATSSRAAIVVWQEGAQPPRGRRFIDRQPPTRSAGVASRVRR